MPRLFLFRCVEKTRPRYFFPQVTDSEQTKPPAPYLQAGVRAAIRSTKPTRRALRRPPGPCLTTAARAGTSNFPLNKSGPRARRSRAATAEAHLAPPRRNHECCVYLVCGHNIIAPSFFPSFVGLASMAWWRSRDHARAGIATSRYVLDAEFGSLLRSTMSREVTY